jgi:hypothetical protein
MVLDLEEVTLVDLEVVRFLDVCEAEGIALLHCSPYSREWIARKQHRAGLDLVEFQHDLYTTGEEVRKKLKSKTTLLTGENKGHCSLSDILVRLTGCIGSINRQGGNIHGRESHQLHRGHHHAA